MPGDEVQEEAGAPASELDAGRGRGGPRHAAPRKPLLNRLHVPAGKAVALAAMPSAVLMGMGLTPTLAHASPLPKNPFKDGPCVSQEDQDEAAKEKAEKEKAEEAKEKAEKAKEKAEKAKEKAEKEGAGKEAGKDESSDSLLPSPSESASSDAGTESEESEGFSGPLDALGLDKALGLDGRSGSDEASSAPSSSASGSSTADDGDSGKASAAGAGDAVNKVGDAVKDVTDGVGGVAKGAKGDLPVTDRNESADEEGKEAYPCVEEKLSGGKDENTAVKLPNDAWDLEATKLELHGLNYEGVVNVTTANGNTKQALKFTADSLDIVDLHQMVGGPGGTTYHVEAAKGSTSTIDGGKVTMYTERLEGFLFGLIPVVFDPKHPPPINTPEAMFTNVKVKQAGQFGGNLTVPGLHQYVAK